MNMKWDADKYTKDFGFVHQYGNDVIELIDNKSGNTILDLGCGNGALTKQLSDKGFSVMGIDASNELLEIARNNYPEIEFIQADATDFKIENPVDIVFSNAVFHWINKDRQGAMLSCVYDALNKGGQFVFEFGGEGNNALIHDALNERFAEYGFDYKMPFYFPSIGEYATLLERSGFKVEFALTFDRFTELKGEDGLKNWIEMFNLTPFSIIDDDTIKEEMINKAVAKLKDKLYKDDKWHADYVRLRVKAVKN